MFLDFVIMFFNFNIDYPNINKELYAYAKANPGKLKCSKGLIFRFWQAGYDVDDQGSVRMRPRK